MKKNKVGTILILVVILSFIYGYLGTYFILLINNNNTTSNIITSYSSIPLNESNSINEGVEKIYKSTVVIEAYSKNANGASTGTGFIYKESKGIFYIMTNHHVINGSEKINVILSDKTVLEAELKGSEIYSDIAVLTVKTDKIKTIAKLGDSNKLNVGDTLFTVGAPEGTDYANTVTKGILSGKDRLVAVALTNTQTSDYYMKVLQTDAAINRGNSGGPICNINGEVIGITALKLTGDSVEGMGFAIPIEDALFYAKTLEKGEKIERPYVGIGMLDITDGYTMWQNGIMLPENITNGVAVVEVADNSPAKIAKLKKGDIIISVEKQKIKSVAEFRYVLYKYSPDDSVKIKYIRNGKEKTTTIKLIKNPNQ